MTSFIFKANSLSLAELVLRWSGTEAGLTFPSVSDAHNSRICVNATKDIIIPVTGTMFTMLSSLTIHCNISPGSSHKWQTNSRTKCTNSRHQSTVRLLVLPSLKADTHFTVPQRVKGWVGLGTIYSNIIILEYFQGHNQKFILGGLFPFIPLLPFSVPFPSSSLSPYHKWAHQIPAREAEGAL